MNYNLYITILYFMKWNINQSYKWFNKNLLNYIVSSNAQIISMKNFYLIDSNLFLSIIRILLFGV